VWKRINLGVCDPQFKEIKELPDEDNIESTNLQTHEWK